MKRLTDISISALALLILFPVMFIIALLVRIKLGSPVIFRQIRAGLDEQEIEVIKFRTMSTAVDDSGELLPDQDRLTAFGKFLRRFRLDELPMFVSVLQGRLSMVGPRPLLPETLQQSAPEHSALRHSIRPGFTGLSQVSGNTLLSYDEKILVDLYYVEHRNWWLDAQILLRTFITVINGERRDEQLLGKLMPDGNHRETLHDDR